MNIIFYPPPKYLQNYIRYFWSCDFHEHPTEKTIYFDNYADKYPRLVFQADNKPRLLTEDNNSFPRVYICGIDLFPSSTSIEANFSHFGVSFTPFALSEVFKVSNELLVNGNIDLNDIGFSSLITKLSDADSHAVRIEIMCRFIEDQINKKKLVNSSVIQIVLTNELNENADLFNLQKKYKTTERTMERLFKNAIGVSPKTFQRLTRFEKTLTLLRDPAHINSASVGYLLNYTDQSHFIKEFKKFTNITPSQFQKSIFFLSESSVFISDSKF